LDGRNGILRGLFSDFTTMGDMLTEKMTTVRKVNG